MTYYTTKGYLRKAIPVFFLLILLMSSAIPCISSLDQMNNKEPEDAENSDEPERKYPDTDESNDQQTDETDDQSADDSQTSQQPPEETNDEEPPDEQHTETEIQPITPTENLSNKTIKRKTNSNQTNQTPPQTRPLNQTADNNTNTTRYILIKHNETITNLSDPQDEQNLPPQIEEIITNTTENTTEYIAHYNQIQPQNRIKIIPRNHNQTAIREIRFKTKTNQTNVSLSIKNIPEKPPEIRELPENAYIYKYIEIKLFAQSTYVQEHNISEMNFTFTVNSTWLEEHNLTNKSILLIRYHNGTWEILNTTLTSENETEHTYQATTPGLSTFAIVGSEIIPDESRGSPIPSIPWVFIAGFILGATVIIIVVIFKAEYIYSEEQQKTKKK